MKRVFLTLASIFFAVSAAFGQAAKSDEEIIRDLVRRSDTDQSAIKYTENRIFVTGLYPRPIIGKRNAEEEKIYAEATATRKNRKQLTKIVRVVVSDSKDLAYEFSTYSQSWDDKDGKQAGFTASRVRVWQKIKGEWLVEVTHSAPLNAPIGGESEKK